MYEIELNTAKRAGALQIARALRTAAACGYDSVRIMRGEAGAEFVRTAAGWRTRSFPGGGHTLAPGAAEKACALVVAPQSRSVARRVAIQRGAPMPEFDTARGMLAQSVQAGLRDALPLHVPGASVPIPSAATMADDIRRLRDALRSVIHVANVTLNEPRNNPRMRGADARGALDSITRIAGGAL